MCNVIKAAHRFAQRPIGELITGHDAQDEDERDRDAERNEVGGPVGVVAALVVIAIGLLVIARWAADMWVVWWPA